MSLTLSYKFHFPTLSSTSIFHPSPTSSESSRNFRVLLRCGAPNWKVLSYKFLTSAEEEKVPSIYPSVYLKLSDHVRAATIGYREAATIGWVYFGAQVV